MRRNRTRSTPAHALKPNDGFQVVTGGESAAQQIGDPMTPTPSHVATDELIETLERRRTKSMAFEPKFGDALFVTLSISEASALISALKENKRLREALSDATEAIIMMSGSSDFASDGQAGAWWTKFRDEKFYPAILFLTTTAALQPQGDAKP